jgi:site-specific recombinase XerD
MGTTQSTPNPQLKTLLENFETWMLSHTRLSVKTAVDNAGYLRRAFPSLGADPPRESIERYIAQIRKEGRLSYASICNICKALEQFTAFLGRPCKLARPPYHRRTVPGGLSEAEVAVFLHAARGLREKAMLAVIAYTGIRNQELCHLRVRNLDIARGLLTVEDGKGHKCRTIAMAAECMALVVEYLQAERSGARPEDWLFVTRRHKHQLATQDVRKWVRVITRRAELDRRIWPHLFRHSLASNLIDRGASPLTVRDQLGHVYLETTMLYVHRSAKSLSLDYRAHAPCYM